MRRLSAYYVFPVSSAPLPFGIIETADDGTIIRIIDTGGNLKESSRLEFYQGILVPGIVFDAAEPRGPAEVCKYILGVQKSNTTLSLNEILRSLTLNAAKRIALDGSIGSLEKGKNPGIMLIDDVDLENMKLTEESTLKVLIVTGS